MPAALKPRGGANPAPDSATDEVKKPASPSSANFAVDELKPLGTSFPDGATGIAANRGTLPSSYAGIPTRKLQREQRRQKNQVLSATAIERSQKLQESSRKLQKSSRAMIDFSKTLMVDSVKKTTLT